MSRWLIGIGILTLMVGLGGAGYGVWTIWSQHELITSARPVQATVLEHRTQDLKASGFTSKVPLVKYEYTVDQRPYTCETVTPAELMLPNTWSESVFQQFPVGARTEAKYDPDDPKNAFLIGKYSVKPYLPLLVSLVIAALGIGVIGDQLSSRDTAAATVTTSGSIVLGAKQHHLASARVLGMIGVVGLLCGGPAIAHHLMVSTPPHERMGFLMTGSFGIAVLTVLIRSAMQLRRGNGFGTPLVTLDRSPAVGQPIRFSISVPARFHGTASLKAQLKCEAKDTRLFNLSEEKPDTALLAHDILLAAPRPVRAGDEVSGTAEFAFPIQLPPSTPVDSKERQQIVWSLTVLAEGSGGRQAETEFILPVA